MPKSSSSVGAISAKMPSCSFGLSADTIKNGTGLVVCAVYGWLVSPSYIFSRLPWSAVMQTAPPFHCLNGSIHYAGMPNHIGVGKI